MMRNYERKQEREREKIKRGKLKQERKERK